MQEEALSQLLFDRRSVLLVKIWIHTNVRSLIIPELSEEEMRTYAISRRTTRTLEYANVISDFQLI